MYVYILLLIGLRTNAQIIAEPSSAEICIGEQVTLIVKGDSAYVWSLQEGIISISEKGDSVIVNPEITTTYTVTSLPEDYITKVVVKVNPLPIADQIADIIVCPGQLINSINFTGQPIGNVYKWSNNSILLGLAASGTGNIASWTAPANNGSSILSSTITVIPTSLKGCIRAPMKFNISILPVPNVYANPTDTTICNNTQINIKLNSTPILSGLTYHWSVSAPVMMTGWSYGTGTEINQTLQNPSNQIGIVTYTITPNIGGCSGTPISVKVSIFPTIQVLSSPSSIITCSGQIIRFMLISNIPGASFTWTVGNVTGITGASGGSGSTIMQTVTNTTNKILTYYYIVTPSFNNCTGNPDTLRVTIPPKPDVNGKKSDKDSICSGETTNINLSSSVEGTTFSWSVESPTGIIGATNGTGDKILQTLTSALIIPATVTYTVTPRTSCEGVPEKLFVTVKPSPDASIGDNDNNIPFVKCSNSGQTDFTLNVINNSKTKTNNILYEINWGDGTSNYSASIIPNDIASHTYNNQGSYQLTMTVTSKNGCLSKQKQNVFFGNNPLIGISSPGLTNGCTPMTLNFPINYGINGNAPGTKYTISINDGSADSVYYQPFSPDEPIKTCSHLFKKTSCGTEGGFNENSFEVKIRAENQCGQTMATISPIYVSSQPEVKMNVLPDTSGIENEIFTFEDFNSYGCVINNNGSINSEMRKNWTITPSMGWVLTEGNIGNANPTNDPITWGSTIIKLKFTTQGKYFIKYKLYNGCGNSDTTSIIYIHPTVSINDIQKSGSEIYFDENNKIINIKGEGIREINIYNIYGSMVINKKYGNKGLGEEHIDLMNFAEGVYIMRVYEKDNFKMLKFIKR